jgi:hypothetical protein
MQHQAMLMYTSCGWFFSDISGIETVQNLRYAARAIELAAPFAPLDLEAVLLEDLARARSNVSTHQDGRRIWERQVQPSRVLAEHAAARLLLEGVLGRAVAPQLRYRWNLTPEAVVREGGLVVADVRGISEVTGEALRFVGTCLREGRFDFLAAIAPWPASGGWSAFVEEATAVFGPTGSGLEAWTGRHGARLLRLRHFLPDERQAILEEMLEETQASLAGRCDLLAGEALPVAEAMVDAGMPLPEWLKATLEAAWSRQLAETLEKLEGVTDPTRYVGIMDLVAQARELDLYLDLEPASTWFGRMLVQRLDAIADTSVAGDWQAFLELLQLGARLTLRLPERALQDRMFAVLRTRVPGLLDGLRESRDEGYSLASVILAVAARLNLNTDEARERLRPLEEQFAADPSYWP